jgi:RHS repeat-associated protein
VTGITYPSSATNSFVYNGEDLRVSKTDSAGTSAQITDGTAPASPVLKDARAVYTPGLSERAGTTSKFYHGDALGSTRGITNSSQTVTDAVLYDAFGMTVSRTGTTPTPFGFVGAQGYQSDSDSGLQLLGHRYYDPSIGRFLSSDPAKAGTNWYDYCENGPLAGTDPTGLDVTIGTGFSESERLKIIAIVWTIYLTPRGNKLLRNPARPNITIYPLRESDSSSDLPYTDPKTTGGNIYFDPAWKLDSGYVWKFGDPKNPTYSIGNPLMVLAHEIGHAGSGLSDRGGDTTHLGINGTDNEVPIMKELGYAPRLGYEPIPLPKGGIEVPYLPHPKGK